MLDKERIEPHKVTKPIQLLAAWLVGLIVIDSCFLVAAAKLEPGRWETSALIIAAIVNVPIFLVALFLLQTKFRPELQEDIYYSQYLDKKTDKVVTISKHEVLDSRALEIKSEISKLISLVDKKSSEVDTSSEKKETKINIWKWAIAMNDHLDNFQEIREELKAKNIPVKSIFGKVGGIKRPSKMIVSFNEYVDFQSKLTLLTILSKYNFDGYMYSDEPNPVDPEDIYIGSYGFSKQTIIPITDELKGFLSKENIDEIDLKYIEQKLIGKKA